MIHDRAMHLVVCKQRAMEIYQRGDLEGAVVAMLRGLAERSDTRAMAEARAAEGGAAVAKRDHQKVTDFIESFQ